MEFHCLRVCTMLEQAASICTAPCLREGSGYDSSWVHSFCKRSVCVCVLFRCMWRWEGGIRCHRLSLCLVPLKQGLFLSLYFEFLFWARLITSKLQQSFCLYHPCCIKLQTFEGPHLVFTWLLGFPTSSFRSGACSEWVIASSSYYKNVWLSTCLLGAYHGLGDMRILLWTK